MKAEYRTTNEIEADKIDALIFNLVAKIITAADKVDGTKRDRYLSAASAVNSARPFVRIMMHEADIKATQG